MYLVAPRGHTQWVRNLRVAGDGQLLLGRRRQRFVASEIADADKEPILRSYLRRSDLGGRHLLRRSRCKLLQRRASPDRPDHPIFRIELV